MSPWKLYSPSSSSSASSSIGPSIDAAIITILTIDITGQATPIQTISTYPSRGLVALSFHPTQQMCLSFGAPLTIRYLRGQYLSLDIYTSHSATYAVNTTLSKCFQQPASGRQSSQSSSPPSPANLTSPRGPPHSSTLSTLETLIFSRSSPATRPSPLPRTPLFQGRLVSLVTFFPTFTLQFTRLLIPTLTPTPTLTLPSQLTQSTLRLSPTTPSYGTTTYSITRLAT